MQTRHLLSSAALALAFCASGAFAADSCRTVANGVQKCDVTTGLERSRDAVVADIRGGSPYAIEGCRTVANGVQKCDLPASYQRGDTAVAKAHTSPVEAH